MTETDFTIDWLSERFRFDCLARNKKVEQSCINYFQGQPVLSIVDIGAGHGSNFFYLFPKFTQHQNWTLVELNADLLEAALTRMAQFAKANKYPCKRTGQTIIFKAGNKEIRIRGIHASFMDLKQLIRLEATDLVTAGAVFDLLSITLFEQLAQQLINSNTPLLSTINYNGMAFSPQAEKDAYFIQLYGAHMQREQSFGNSMGPECTSLMLAFFERNNISVKVGESNWEITPGDVKMHHHLLHYLENAISEILFNQGEMVLFEQWIKEKKHLLETHLLNTNVFHQDLFTYF